MALKRFFRFKRTESTFDLLRSLFTISLTGIGFAFGGNLGLGLVAGLGVNLMSDIVSNTGFAKLKERWLTSEYGIKNSEIQKTLFRAIKKTLAGMRSQYLKENMDLPKYKKLGIDAFFDKLDNNINEDQFLQSELSVKETGIRAILDQRQDIALSGLLNAVNLNEYAEGKKVIFDESFSNFFQKHFLSQLRIAFLEELHKNNKAKVAYLRLLLDGFQADIRVLLRSQERTQMEVQELRTALARLQDLDTNSDSELLTIANRIEEKIDIQTDMIDGIRNQLVFKDLVAEAEKFSADGHPKKAFDRFSEALGLYELGLQPDKFEIEEYIRRLRQQLQIQYRKHLSYGEGYLRSSEWQEALKEFRSASQMYLDGFLPEIADLKTKMQKAIIGKRPDFEQRFTKAVRLSLTSKKEAIREYRICLSLVEDSYVPGKAEIEKVLESVLKEQEMEYQKLIQAGDAKFKAKDWPTALALYNEAESILEVSFSPPQTELDHKKREVEKLLPVPEDHEVFKAEVILDAENEVKIQFDAVVGVHHPGVFPLKRISLFNQSEPLPINRIRAIEIGNSTTTRYSRKGWNARFFSRTSDKPLNGIWENDFFEGLQFFEGNPCLLRIPLDRIQKINLSASNLQLDQLSLYQIRNISVQALVTMKAEGEEFHLEKFPKQYTGLKFHDLNGIEYLFPLLKIQSIEFTGPKIKMSSLVPLESYLTKIALVSPSTAIQKDLYFRNQSISGKYTQDGFPLAFKGLIQDIRKIDFFPSMTDLPDFGELKLIYRDARIENLPVLVSFDRRKVLKLTENPEDVFGYDAAFESINKIELIGNDPLQRNRNFDIWKAKMTARSGEESIWCIHARNMIVKLRDQFNPVQRPINKLKTIIIHQEKRSAMPKIYPKGENLKALLTGVDGIEYTVENLQDVWHGNAKGRSLRFWKQLSTKDDFDTVLIHQVKVLEFNPNVFRAPNRPGNFQYKKVSYQLADADWREGICVIDGFSLSGFTERLGLQLSIRAPFKDILRVKIDIVS